MPVSQDLLRPIKQLSRAVALRGVFIARQDRLAFSLYALPVFDTERLASLLLTSSPTLPSPARAPRSDAGRPDGRGKGAKEYVRNLVTM